MDMKAAAISLLVCIALAPVADAADQPLTRQQVLRALVDPDPVTRRAAASQLGAVGHGPKIPRGLLHHDEG